MASYLPLHGFTSGDFARSAQSLGLRVAPNNRFLAEGNLGFGPIWVAEREGYTPLVDTYPVFTTYGITFTRPLRMGLHFHSQIGSRWNWGAHDPAHAQEFFRRAGSHLERLGSNGQIALDDFRLTLEEDFTSMPHRWREILGMLSEVAEHLMSTRADLPTPLDGALDACFGRVAMDLSGHYDPATYLLKVPLGAFSCDVGVLFRATVPITRSVIGLAMKTDFEVTLTPERDPTWTERLLASHDVVLGDPDFDSRVLVRGKPVEKVWAALSPSVRAALLSPQMLASFHHIANGALVSEVSGAIESPDALRAHFECLRAVASGLNPHAAGSTYPYR